MRNKISICGAIFLAFMMAGFFSIPHASGDDSPRISIEKLQALLGSPDLSILDVRIEKHWNSSDIKVKGAVREKPSEFDAWADKYPKDKTIVLY